VLRAPTIVPAPALMYPASEYQHASSDSAEKVTPKIAALWDNVLTMKVDIDYKFIVSDPMYMSKRLARTVATCVALALLGACSKPDDQTPDVDPAVPAPVEPLQPSPIVDLRVWDSGKRVCVLHADGRVACAATDATEFEPPLESLGLAVELTSASLPIPQVCVRGEQGPVRCLDGKGEVHQVEGVSDARSLESNCAVNSKGGLLCWDESFVAKPAALPHLPYGELEHVVLVYEGLPMAGGCALRTDGALWCWLDAMESLGVDLGEPVQSGGHSEADTYAPVQITDVGDGSQVLELSTSNGVCWRLPSGWTCARQDVSTPFPPPGRIDNVVEPDQQCDTHPCNCSFPCAEESCQFLRALSCVVPQPGEQFIVDSHHLSGVVRFSGKCVVDVNNRVWCQTEKQPVHELRAIPARM
jgi:hypothetical protein